jgi:hypothetical protein
MLAKPCCADPDRVSYPNLYIDLNDKDALKSLPDSGVMTVRFKVVGRNEHMTDGKYSCNVCLEVQKVVDVEADPGTEPNDRKDREATLSKLADAEGEDEDEDKDEEAY